MEEALMEGIAMASGSESAAEKVEPRWEVGPTEDVVQALMETLVDPLLPFRVSCTPPSEDIQIAVAKQMHAVVLLYNYHHRKQKPELVFLEFVKFCKLAIVIRPPLIKFMKLMKESKLQELNCTEDLLSITEKAIKDACNIALGLDASRDVPNMEGWPISKVAVVLIDSKKENCMLQFDADTEGAWSLFEKELSVSSSITPEKSAGDKVGNKRKRDILKVSTYNTEFLQLGYDVVKDVTGISISDVEVLETRMTYSLSKEKSAACFYIMQCPGPFNERNQVPLKFLAESVQGPFAERVANGSWKTTPLVKLYRMLPYAELILSSLSGCEVEVNSSDQKASPVDIVHEKDGNLNNKFVKRFDFLDSTQSSQNEILEHLADGNEQADKCLSSRPSRGLSDMVMKIDNALEESGKGCDMADPTAEVASRITGEHPDTESDDPVSGLSKGLFGKAIIDESERKKFNEKHDVGHSDEKDERRFCPEKLDDKDGVGCGKDIFSGSPRVLEASKINDLTENCSDTDDNKMPNTTLIVYHHRRKKNSSRKNVTQFQEDVQGLEVDMVDALESNQTQRKDEKVSGDEGCLTNTCNQTGSASTAIRDEKVARDEGYLYQIGTASTENQQAQLKAEIKPNAEVPSTLDSFRPDHIQSRDEKLSGDKGDLTQECNHTGIAFAATRIAQVEARSKHDLGANTTSGSDHLQNALALLYRKRREVYSQICNMEDALALCEDNVARIRDGGEVDLARQCIESVISGKFDSLMENGTQVQDKDSQQHENVKSQHGKPTKLSDAYLVGTSSCQDLEYTCVRNNWRMPRYLTESSDGKFLSNVVVEGKDFKLHAKGGLESNPCEARETAAAQMINVMHTTFF